MEKPESSSSMAEAEQEPSYTAHHLTIPLGLNQSELDEFHNEGGVHPYVNVISGLPAATSTERLDILDDDRQVSGFTIIGGEHRLRNYRSVTTVHGFERDGGIWTVVLESYVVDVPEGNTEEDTRLFADTVVKLNLQKLASVARRVMLTVNHR
ncbi:hypothetical protein GH714_015156 [Hevea brasiliensis]|uniref:Bet v I/Major latex protein domain-containing protein n=1 Tax=Hevea brasiliensis TaxID=3981 RepID=A0A6A6LC26_HEVBR|nr:hypothetical protein GH714_015156 [Hevea brasiliensis]